MQNDSPLPEFTIVGASPAGYTFALSLLHHHQSVKPSDILIIETNPERRSPGGPFWLTPNSLRILDQLKCGATGESIYKQCRSQGYSGTRHMMRNMEGEFLGSMLLGGADRFGYDALRIDRGIVLANLQAEVEKQGIHVEYSTSLREIVAESDNTIEFIVRKGHGETGQLTTMRAKRLIGADGIHSRTRTFVSGREIKAAYSGHFMAAAYIPRSRVTWGAAFAEAERNKEYALSVTGRLGTVLMIPNDPLANTLQIGRQWPSPDWSREEWDALSRDKVRLLEYFVKDKDQWSDLPRSLLDNITAEDIYIVWPMKLLPTLERWASGKGRAVIIGDAAHTVIPASAQGANQAFEDGWTLAQVYAQSAMSGKGEIQCLKQWETKRIERLQRISQLSVQLMNVRLPPEDQAKLNPEDIFNLNGGQEEMERRLDWLYSA